MGLRFRKSVKIAPGVKINFGKKSMGMSIGGKYGGMSFNTKNGARVRSSIPGTGISYSTKVGGSQSKSKTSSSQNRNHTQSASKPVSLRWWYITIIVIFAIGGLGNIGDSIGAAIFGVSIAVIMSLFTINAVRKKEKKENQNNTSE